MSLQKSAVSDISNLIHYAVVSTPSFRKKLSSKSRAILSKEQMQDWEEYISVAPALKLHFLRVEKSASEELLRETN